MYQEDNKTSVIKTVLSVLLFVLIFILAVKLITMVFNSRKSYLDNNNMEHNINSLQNAAINYFKTGVLSNEDNSTLKVTLKDLMDKEYISELKDEYKFICSVDDSYVEALKTGNEYRIKTYLKCNNKSDYVYTFLDSESLKEKKDEEPTTTVVPETTTTTTTSTTTTTKVATTKTTKKTKEVTTTTTTTTTTQPRNTEPVVITTTKPAIEKWNINYNCNGGTINGTPWYHTGVEKGQEIILPVPVKKGYTFWHWEDSTGKVYSGSLKPTSDITLVAKWY